MHICSGIKSVLFQLHRLMIKTMALAAFVFFWFIPSEVYSQSAESNRQKAERILERLVSELDPEDSEQQIRHLVELVEELVANPVNINRAEIEELNWVPGLSLRQAQAIIDYRVQVQPYEQVHDLLNADGIGPATLQQIEPFLTVGTARERSQDLLLDSRYWTRNSRFEILSRVQSVIQEQEGYRRPDTLGGYTGSPLKYNHRYRYRSDRLSMNLTQDKDPGEPLESFHGFDYTSWHVAVAEAGWLQSLVIGDYRVSYGQGLILWNGGGFGKSSQTVGSILKNDTGVRPYTSSQETNAFRGVAGSFGNSLQISAFYSDRKRTASEAEDGAVRFPTQTALHRTENELARRHNLGQITYGGRVRYLFRRGIAGVSGFRNSFDRPVVQGNQPYQLHRFEGDRLSAYSADFRFTVGPAILFSEAAATDNGGIGLIGGSDFRFINGTGLSLAYRNYSANFQSIFGSGFSEQTSAQNEEGLYIGIHQPLGSSFAIRAYIDQFRTHAPRFRNSRPTSGYDWLARLEYEPKSDFNIYAQFRFKQNEQEVESLDIFGRSLREMSHTIRSNARVQVEYSVSESVRLRTRVDVVRAIETVAEPSYGVLLFQDVRIIPHDKVTADMRVTLFDTDDFTSRVFQFENDLLYVMSNPMLFDQGQRMYALVRYQPIPALTIRMKIASTLYENRTTIGSGLDQITGNRRTDVGLQVRILI